MNSKWASLAGVTALALGLIAVFVAGLPIPFLSDDHAFLEHARQRNLLDAWGAGRVALKPVHDLVFHWGARLTGPDAARMRLPAFLGHALALWFVHRIARQVGAGRAGAWLATLLYATFAVERSLLWPSAVSGFLRVTFALGALSFYLDRAQGARSGALALLCVLLSVASHQSGALTPVMFLIAGVTLARTVRDNATTAFSEGATSQVGVISEGATSQADVISKRAISKGEISERAATSADPATASWVRTLANRFRVPVVVLAFAIVAVYVYWSLQAPDQYRSWRQAGAIMANAARALVALLPFELREPILGALRGDSSTGKLLGFAALSLVAGVQVLLFLRGGPVWRFALLVGAVDLGLAIATVGFSQRYAYLTAALAAVAIGRSFATATSRRRRAAILAVVLVLGCSWALEKVRVTGELQEAGAVSERVLEQAVHASEHTPDAGPLLVLNLPDVWGRQQDLPLLNWGFAPALRMRGVKREVRELRTFAARTSTAAAWITVREADRLRTETEAGGLLLEFDPETKQLVQWRGGKRVPVGQ